MSEKDKTSPPDLPEFPNVDPSLEKILEEKDQDGAKRAMVFLLISDGPWYDVFDDYIDAYTYEIFEKFELNVLTGFEFLVRLAKLSGLPYPPAEGHELKRCLNIEDLHEIFEKSPLLRESALIALHACHCEKCYRLIFESEYSNHVRKFLKRKKEIHQGKFHDKIIKLIDGVEQEHFPSDEE